MADITTKLQVNVKRFGAIGNGNYQDWTDVSKKLIYTDNSKTTQANDDTQAIDDEIVYAKANNIPTIFLPHGSYQYKGILIVDSNIQLHGDNAVIVCDGLNVSGTASIKDDKLKGIVVNG